MINYTKIKKRMKGIFVFFIYGKMKEKDKGLK